MAKAIRRKSRTYFNPEIAQAARLDAYCVSMKPEWTQTACSVVRAAVEWDSERDGVSNVKGYKWATYFKDDRGKEVASVHWNYRGAFVDVKGEHTPTVAAALRSHCPHQVTRVDICIDFRDPTAYMRLLKALLLVQDTHSRLRAGPLPNNDPRHPEEGLGYRLGRPSSLLKVKIYEKGKSKEYRGTGVDDWTRLEFQFNFSRKAMKVAAAGLGPIELISTNQTARKVMNKVFGMKLTPFETPPRLSHTAEIVVGKMLTQYRNRLREAAEKKGTATVMAWVHRTIVDPASPSQSTDQLTPYLSGGSDGRRFSFGFAASDQRMSVRSRCPRDRSRFGMRAKLSRPNASR